jgi:hypothetical protein
LTSKKGVWGIKEEVDSVDGVDIVDKQTGE